MAAMLPDAAPQDALDRVRGLPFVELSSDGLVVHDTVREVVAAYLRAADPDRSRRYRIAAWRLLRDEVTRATSHEMWRYTADLLYILESPAVREGFFPTSEHRYFVEPANAEDWPAIRAIAAACEPPESVAIFEDWWRRLPDAFWTARDGAGRVAGFTAAAELDTRAALVVRRRSALPGSGATTSGVRRSHAANGSSASAGTWHRRTIPSRPSSSRR